MTLTMTFHCLTSKPDRDVHVWHG